MPLEELQCQSRLKLENRGGMEDGADTQYLRAVDMPT